ncbi:DUF3159 domain-containing protein [Cellulomonas endophytica]|uniref:DUF3159 domain-containing protein n=1 Tax=Cellulomonas endophytica TaxID=2494735 RepID=UPI0013E91371|nr:DUF3159 domain-containing protein [Cellulomonas endophytica]
MDTTDPPTAGRAPDGTARSPSSRAREALGLPEPTGGSTARAAGRRALERVGGPVGLAAAAAPTVAFVVADAAAGLGPALLALGATAVAACTVRLARREPPGAAVAGLLVAAVCAAVAALVGEARAFFLPTMVLPVVFVAAYAVSFAVRRPLAGLMVHPFSGGPRDWGEHRELRRLYTASSVVGLALAATNLVVRVAAYRADEPAVLAAVQVGATTLFALHYAVTLVLARRAAGASPAAPARLTAPHPLPAPVTTPVR